MADGTSEDVNGNTFPDECEQDCNSNGVFDFFDLIGGTSLDCDGNSFPDECDIADGTQPDCNGDGVPDVCTSFKDCNANGIPDECDVVGADCNGNGIPDDCEQDTDGDTVPDACDDDVDGDGVPNECDIDEVQELVHPEATFWSSQEGGNDHAYLFVDGIWTWEDATQFAQEHGAHLATIISPAEDDFVTGLIPGGGGVCPCPMIGGFQDFDAPDFSEPAGGWRWVTGEQWAYSRWSPSNPSDSNAGEDYLEIILNEGWNDTSGLGNQGIIIEWSRIDCNSNGIIDRCELESNDCNANGLPDDCDLDGNDCNVNGVV